MDRVISNSRPDIGSDPSPSPNSNIGLSLLERINRVLGKKRDLSSGSGMQNTTLFILLYLGYS